MDLNNWLLFVQLIDFGGLSAASRKLGLPKSTLSRRLTRLEDEFGARLLIRRGRTFELTDLGQTFYQEARRLTEHVNQANERLAELSNKEGGTLRMTAPKATGSQFLGIWLTEFYLTYPHIKIELDLNDQMVNIFEQGYDLALRVGPLTDSTLVARKIGYSERVLVATSRYINKFGQPDSPMALQQHKCVGFGEQRSGLCSWILKCGKQSEHISFNPALRCDDMATISRVVQSGMGIAMIPVFVCRELLAAKKLHRILPQWSGPVAEFYLVYPERKLMPKRVQLLVNFLAKCAKTENWRLAAIS